MKMKLENVEVIEYKWTEKQREWHRKVMKAAYMRKRMRERIFISKLMKSKKATQSLRYLSNLNGEINKILAAF